MLPKNVEQPKKWTDQDRWICTARWLHALTRGLFEYCVANPDSGIPLGQNGDPCFNCPAGDRCPSWCDEKHPKRYTEFYAFENFKVVEQFASKEALNIDDILEEICNAPQTKNHTPEG